LRKEQEQNTNNTVSSC